MAYPGFGDYLQFAKSYNLVPVYEEVITDTETAITVYEKLNDLGPSFLLESVEGGERLARYSFMGFKPAWILKDDGEVIFDKDRELSYQSADIITALREILSGYRTAPVFEHTPRFFGGAVGFFGYELSSIHLRNKGRTAKTDLLPDNWLMFPQLVVIMDHVQHRLKLVALVEIHDCNPSSAYQSALELLEDAKKKLRMRTDNRMLPLVQTKKLPDYISQPTSQNFLKMVERAKEYIYAGDIFQVVLSRQLQVELKSTPFNIYRALRSLNPSPYMFYIDTGEHQFLGASPEMLVRVEEGTVFHRPIAGTRPRGKNAAEDLEMAKALLENEKEKAEHLMLVDLGRNDVGRVSKNGSVQVSQFMGLERYSHVMHMVSEVTGILAPGKDALDALMACFPAGTVSGAPKIRAMEIIKELEDCSRGTYAGAVGYLSLTGNLDTCIAIRSMTVHRHTGYIRAGAGIVADSDPEAEYQETLHKARSLLVALTQAGGGKLDDFNDR